MSRSSTSRMGALHPILFFIMVYGIAIFLAFFVCRTIYYSLSTDEVVSSPAKKNLRKKLKLASTPVNIKGRAERPQVL